LKILIVGLAAVSAVVFADQAAGAFTVDELREKVERIAPPYTTLPGKVMCACAQTNSLSRAVGYLNSYVANHGTYTTVDVWCVYEAYRLDGTPAFTTACADYRLLK
jgi:hypothetical protein